MRFDQWRKRAIERLCLYKRAEYDVDALLSFITGKNRSYILAFSETELRLEQEEQLEQLLRKRESYEPLAYLIGKSEFWSLNIEVSPVTLIPRNDTECLVEKALELLPNHACTVLDLGTGTGAIALALASERPDCQFIGVDYLVDAIELASRNASRLKIANTSFIRGNWFEPIQGHKFMLIISNPPYIDELDPHLLEKDIRYEPLSALVAPEKGLAYLRHIIACAPDYLIDNGWLLIEHGWKQGTTVRNMLSASGFNHISTKKDYGNNERCSLGQRLRILNTKNT
ncbi:peptide chain release factor N(5)-glutamine methyltransferase [Candidatus Profftia tarda]|uniref:Release factor glutamine methyltransferase n=1 Tax=Candidatus Profftia tarda TaxID=1177216 RepID=A0A8E4H482_9ENTR|nr:peptide chain release factor N(5)-glutamine methyltransferase [Candidatus Profftia tarda]CAD6512776.1 Release factor glutamine methyltransferase [Candidatus Profftia tarda]